MAARPSFTSVTRSGTTINLFWQSVFRATGYDLDRSVNGGTFNRRLFNTQAGSFSDTNLTPGFTYQYRVRSREARPGQSTILSSYSFSVTISIPIPVPATPGAISLARVADLASISVSWSSVTYANNYTLQSSSNGGASYSPVGTFTGTSTTVSGLTRGSTYQFRVRANNNSGSSAYRTTGSLGDLTLRPIRPSSVSASLSGDTSIRVTWTAANGATTYFVNRRENNGAWIELGNTGTSRDVTYSNLNRGSTYQFRVFSANFGGISPTAQESNSVQIPFPPPPAPANVYLTKTKRDIRVTFDLSTPPAGTTILNYEIEIRADGGSYGNRLIDNGSGETYTNLNPGSTYQARVRAIGQGGGSAWRESGTSTISSPPTPPSEINRTRSFRNVFVELGTSTAASDVTISGYEIQRRESTNAGATWGAWGSSVITSTTDRTTTYTNLNALSTYQFRGRALSDFNPGEFTTSDPIFIPGFPDPPQQVLALQEGASVRVILTTPISDGGTPILTYRIEKRVSQDLGTTWSSWDDPVIVPGNQTVYLYEGLVLQKTYQFRALSTNSEGDSESFTESNSVYLPAIVRIRDEGVFRFPNDYKRYDEECGAWIGLSIYQRYFNGQWVDLE